MYCNLDAGEVSRAAEIVARGIAQRRIGMNPRLHGVWVQHLSPETEEGPSVSDSDKELLVAGLLQNVGSPNAPAPLDHLHGLVAEEIWLEIIAEKDWGLGPPIRVEGHDWSATDPGGDGLTVHALKDGAFCFRLWESKYHGTALPIRETVNGACRQVKSRATSYLSRFSLIAQRLTDDAALAGFYGRLPEMWVDRDPAAGVGIVVGASEIGSDDNRFNGMPGYFELEPERHQGQLNTVGDFAVFAMHVRDILWKGCALWIER